MLAREEMPDSRVVFYKGDIPPARGGAVNFAFLIHPLGLEDLGFLKPNKAEAQEWLAKTSQEQQYAAFNKLRGFFRLKVVGRAEVISGNRRCQGVLILIPYLPEEFRMAIKGNSDLRQEIIICQTQALELAKAMNVGIVGTGAFNSIISINGLLLAKRKILPITSGNSLTAFCVCQSITKACREILRIDVKRLSITIVGAYGNIGEAVSKILAPKFGRAYLIGRDTNKVERIAREVDGSAIPFNMQGLNGALSRSQVVVLVTSASSAEELGVDPKDFLPGAIVCDVARPHNVSQKTTEQRPDVFFFEGGIYQFPGTLYDCAHFLRMGGEDSAFACLSETMIRGLRGESISGDGIGKLKLSEIIRMGKLAAELGFILGGYRIFDKPISSEQIEEFERSVRR